MVDAAFWQNKRVLITGHTGFKGSWLSLWLQSLGAEVFGLALPPSAEPALFYEANIAEGMVSTLEDIRDYPTVYKTVAEARPEILFHMAAQPLVRYSYRHPVETYSTNVMGTVHVLEAARQVSTVRAVVNITTDKCYENKEWLWGYRENDRLGGYDPYSSSKACSELITDAYRHSYFNDSGISLASARAGNVVGGGDWSEDRLIPDILRSFGKKEPVIIRNPKAIRPWQHVLEPISGYLILGERLFKEGREYAGAWNFGPDSADARPVEWIVEQMARLWGPEASWRLDSEKQLHEAGLLRLDISKAVSRLGWAPVWNLERALENITDWQRCWLNRDNVQEKCRQQIKRYIADAAASRITEKI